MRQGGIVSFAGRFAGHPVAPMIFENVPEKSNNAVGVFVLQKMQKPWNKSVCVRGRKLCDLREISETVEHGTKSVKWLYLV